MAIAFDSASVLGNNGGTTNTLTSLHSCSGSDRILFIGFAGDTIAGANDITSVTFNGVAATALFTGVTTESDRYYYLYYLINPDAGANFLTITAASTHYLFGVSTSYTGVSQVGFPDASTTNSAAPGGAGTLATSVTTVADNCWTCLFACHNGNGGAPTAGTGSTRRALSSFNANALFDSNAPKTPAGSASMSVTWFDPTTYGIGTLMWSIAPAGAASATWPGYISPFGWT